ncbi:spore germination protein GerW family protein [Nocardia sp. NBC_01009]|uniref:spore germination protein GerW family protein n=1 Tax=Nocardia sp. NBC_01009 TaxID=2975996 RepID=UPI003864D6F2|nr:spore germination protein GerW family protein [Nocardia sp. NBC_01009]
MKVEDVLARTKDSMTVERVFAEPVERDGTTVITAAAISGGAGAGAGTDVEGKEGSGGGFGVGAKPVGAYVLKDGQVRWQPAIDVNRLVTIAGVVTIVAAIVGLRIASLRARAAHIPGSRRQRKPFARGTR